MTIRRALNGVLIFQLGLGGLLVLGDMQGMRLPRFGPDAPSLTDPVRPGDQTRRYRPDRERPGGRPMPATPLPDRLTLGPLSQDGTIRVQGTIAPGDAPRIGTQLERMDPAPKTLVLNSPGGSVQDALALGRAVRAAGYATAMDPGDICYSACPYLLAGGTARDIPDDASVGVHQHYFGESTILPAFVAVEDIQRGQGDVMGYLDEMGIDPLVMRHALTTPPDEIYLLLPEELVRYGFSPMPTQ
ncbi:hypothetical protein [Sulfitobacter sabulilitoris]|uniref:Periplasmic protein-like protein n=1 Tax=Sulfitobacter sabulilitoris TaxID=2562655 RepID=A0A5S3PL79_9RHOB|nr:hypothetical protein [Sulfitobacter sabulilitoris]TMM55081.1 hypothetical protein FDT80_05795 [Sulfitobacter sabulilitoris]